MKKIPYILVVVIYYIAINGTASAGLNDGLLAHFPFEYTVNDISGNGLSGTLMGNATFKTGKIGYSLYLDGDGDYVDLGNSLNLNNQCSITVWIKSEDLTRRYPAILAKYETNHYGPYDFDLHYDKASVWVSSGSGGYAEIESNISLSQDKWTHIAWVIDGTKIKIYINGTFDVESEIPAITQNNDKVTIGRQALMFPPYNDLQFKGYIDELRVYNRPLDGQEINELYREPTHSFLISTIMQLLL